MESQPAQSAQPVGEPSIRAQSTLRPEPQEQAHIAEQPVTDAPQSEPETSDIYDSHKPDEPITGDEVKEVIGDMWHQAKNVYLIPVRREIRSAFRLSKEFLLGLGSDGKR